jgi:hypothetical protein
MEYRQKSVEQKDNFRPSVVAVVVVAVADAMSTSTPNSSVFHTVPTLRADYSLAPFAD